MSFIFKKEKVYVSLISRNNDSSYDEINFEKVIKIDSWLDKFAPLETQFTSRSNNLGGTRYQDILNLRFRDLEQNK